MSADSEKFQALMNQGHNAAWEQDWSKAYEAYRLAALESPDDPMAVGSAALACYQLEKFEEALQYYQKCALLTPDDPMPFEKMARIYERTGMLIEAVKSFMQNGEKHLKARDADHAISAFKEALRLDPNNQTVRMRLAMIFDKMGLKTESVTEYLFLAALMQAGGDSARASQVLHYALQLDPENVETKKIYSMFEAGQQIPLPAPSKGGTGPVKMAQVRQMETPLTAAAPEEIERPAATAPLAMPRYDPLTEAKLAALKEIAGMLFEQTDDNQSTAQNVRKSMHLLRGTGELSFKQNERSRVQSHLSRTIDLQTAGKDKEAAVELERAIDLGLNLSAGEYLLGLLTAETNPQKAQKHLQKSLRHPDYALGSFLLLAKIAEGSGQVKDACTFSLQALRLADVQTVGSEYEADLSQLYEPIFESQRKITDQKKLSSISQTIKDQLVRPDWREYLKEARSQLPAQPEGSAPMPLAELLLETTNSQVIEALTYIKRLAAEGKLRTAMEEAFHALTFAPVYLPLHAQIGELLIQEGRINEASQKFNVVADLYNVRGETTQAVRLLTRIARLAPMDLAVRAKLIDLLISSGRVDDAIVQYMELANVHYLLAELEQAKQNYQHALSLTNKSSDPRKWAQQILNKLADIELQSLDLKAAIKIMEQLRSLDPVDSTTRSTLIDLYLRIGLTSGAMNELDAYLKILEDGRQFDKAEEFVDRLLADRPDNIEIQKRLVNLFHSTNQIEKAVEKLDALAEKCLRQENKPGALSTLQHLISLDPPNSNDYRRLIEELRNQRI